MKIEKVEGNTLVDGQMNEGFVYIAPRGKEYWLECHDLKDFTIKNWMTLRPRGNFRITRLLSLIPYLWKICK